MPECIQKCLSISNLESLAVILGAVFLAYQIRQQTKIARAYDDRTKKQSTIEFFNLISTKNKEFLDCLGGKPLDLKTVKSDKELKKIVLEHLFSLERLAVGVVADIYDFDILSRMVGRYLTKVYRQLKKYIEEVRVASGSPIRYIEFEKLAKRLEEDRKNHKDKLIDTVKKI